MQKEHVNKYIPIIILGILAVISFLIVRPYILALLSAFILAYLVRPLNEKLERKFPKSISALLTIIITMLLIFIPIGWTLTEVATQGYSLVQSGTISKIIAGMQEWRVFQNYNLESEISQIASKMIQSISNITLSLIGIIISLAIMVFAMYYLLVDWEKISARIKKSLPFANKDKLARDIASTTKKIVHGTLFIALIEFVVTAIGFWIAGVPFFIVLATLTALLAFVPGGPGLVWIPVMIIEIINQNYFSAIVVLITGLIISIYVDTIFRAKVAGKDAKIHPLIALVGILGGTPVFGVLGIIIGPLFLAYTLEIVEEILLEYN
ncbi:MAG: AI-2E family transporter [Candidatus Pacearchaeota archaeon]